MCRFGRGKRGALPPATSNKSHDPHLQKTHPRGDCPAAQCDGANWRRLFSASSSKPKTRPGNKGTLPFSGVNFPLPPRMAQVSQRPAFWRQWACEGCQCRIDHSGSQQKCGKEFTGHYGKNVLCKTRNNGGIGPCKLFWRPILFRIPPRPLD